MNFYYKHTFNFNQTKKKGYNLLNIECQYHQIYIPMLSVETQSNEYNKSTNNLGS